MRDMSEAEFDAALAQYGDTVYRLAFAYTRNRADADDVFQEVFLRYARAWLSNAVRSIDRLTPLPVFLQYRRF